MKDEDGRTLVSATGAAVIGSVWFIGSVLMGVGSSTRAELGEWVEMSLAWAGLTVFPAIVLLLIWSYLD
ncbi:hypothetical protein [Intrasporangium sp. DVR]|uniref:hypothetical protein n=1 Tax=Intrasporangium sp. DVR TaxID=3127867 RepID=UPI00313A6BA2